MKLQTVSRWFFVAVMVGLLANVSFLLLIRGAYQSNEAAIERRAETLRVVTALRHETELLGRLVRSYAATGNPRYLLYYYDILAIREGSKPGPDTDNPQLYWDDVIAGRRGHALPEGQQGVSLIDRMRALDFSATELAAMNQVVSATERLKKSEQEAFAAAQGLFDREKQAYVSEGAPDLPYASELVHSPRYEAQTADLAQAVGALGRATDERTSRERRKRRPTFSVSSATPWCWTSSWSRPWSLLCMSCAPVCSIPSSAWGRRRPDRPGGLCRAHG